MEFQVLVIRLLIAVLDRIMFPNAVSMERDRKHQLLMSNAIHWCDSRKENEHA